MLRVLLLHLLRGVAVVLGVITLTFLLLHLAPGDPVQRLLGPAATPPHLEAARHSLGLDQPLYRQYGRWLVEALQGDFGTSIAQGRPVGRILSEAWPATALLVVLSIVLSYLLGIALGAFQANSNRRLVDALLSTGSVALNAMPSYWLGLALVMVFTYRLRWLPAFGASGVDADFL